MSDRIPPDDDATPPRPPQSQIGLGGADKGAKNLAGIAPAVVDAFLNANGRKSVTSPEAPSPRRPEHLGSFAQVDPQALVQRQLKIRELAKAIREAPAAPADGAPTAADGAPAAAADGPPPAAPAVRRGSSGPLPLPPPTTKGNGGTPIAPPAAPGGRGSGGLSPGDMRAKHLAMRKPGAPGAPGKPPAAGTGRLPAAGTGRLPGLPPSGTQAFAPGQPSPGQPPQGPVQPGDMRLQHLAMRQRAAGTGTGTGRLPDPDGQARLERMVGAAMSSDGIVALRQTIEALEDKQIPAKLSALTNRITELVPGSDGVLKLGADASKRMIVNSLNPMLAISIAAKESAEKIDTLKKWNELSTRERMAATAGLSANLAEIIGAVTPPPVCFGAQVAAAGLTLVSLATDHSETFEDVGARVANTETSRKVASEVSERGAVLAQQVKAAWGELGDRMDQLKAGKRKAPAQLQKVFDSRRFKKLKQHPATKSVATGLENLTYNLTRRWESARANFSHRFRKKP